MWWPLDLGASLTLATLIVLVATLIAGFIQSRPQVAASIAEMQKEKIRMLEAELKAVRAQWRQEHKCCRDRTAERDKLSRDNAALILRLEQLSPAPS